MKKKLRFLKRHLIPLLVVFLFSKVKAESNDSAFAALEELVQKDSLVKDSLNKKYIKAKMLFEAENYPKSLELGYELLKSKDELINIQANYILGKNFEKNNNKVQALKYFEKSLSLIDDIKIGNDMSNPSLNASVKILEAENLIEIANILVNQYNPVKGSDSSFSYLDRLIKMKSLDDHILFLKARAYNTLSVINFRDKKYENAENFVFKSINIFKKLNKENSLSRAYINLANIYEVTNKREEALKTYLKALPYLESNTDAKSIESKELLYYNIAWTMYNLKDYKAYEYLKKSYNLKDSLIDIGLKKELKKIEQIHNIDLIRKEAENKRLSLERNNWFIGGVGFFVALLLLYFTNRYNSKQKELSLKLSLKEFEQQKELDDLQLESQAKILNATLNGKETERKQIAETLHDNVSALLSSANMHLQASQKHYGKNPPIELAKTQRIITEASQKIRDLSHTLVSSILLKFGLEYALKDTAKKYSNSSIKIYTAIADVDRYAQDYEIKIYNIVQELINNILKHSKAAKAFIAMEENDEKLLIIVKDNGAGFDAKKIESSGIGLNQIAARVGLMNGTFTIDSSKNNGTKITLEIPIIKKEVISHV